MKAKKDMLKEICSMSADMFPLLIKAGIRKDKIDIPWIVPEDTKADTLLDAYHWIRNRYQKEYAKYKEARELVPESQWDYYEMMGVTGTTEQRILANALYDLRIAWKTRPQILLPEKKDGKKKKSTKSQGRKKSSK